MAGELVHYAVDRAIATVTLDSPANRNALSAGLVGEVQEHLRAAAGESGRQRVAVGRGVERDGGDRAIDRVVDEFAGHVSTTSAGRG